MAYGLWLYKELDTDYGSVRLEISKRDYTGEAQEIEALAADGIVLSMDGEEITDPIIGTQLSINIVDTGQVDTSLFFTPDSTLYAVALYYGSTLEWYGYLTPDSYIESLDYRDTIALTARDNLGRLNDFEFKQTRGMVSAVELIESLLAEVQCSQYINWSVDKVALAKGEGVSQTTSIQDIWVNTDLFVSEEMTYREVVEEILRGLGCQMRFRSGNNLIVVSISDFYLIADQSAIFIDRSGVKEIKPAWKELSVTQDYGLIENFYNGHISEQEIGWETFFVPSQKSNKWEGDMIFANQYGWPTGIEDDQDTSIFINAIEPYGTYSAFVIPVKATKTTLKLTMQLNNTLRWLRDNVFRKTSNLYYGGDGANHVISYNITHHIQIIMRNAAGEKYIMSPGDWIRDDNIFAHIDWFQFKLDDCVYDDESTWNKDKECSIQINTIPFDGDLLIAFRTATWDEENRDIPNHMLYAKIKDITLKFDNNIGEKSANVQIKAAHNVTEELELKMGQVPYGKGDYLAYAGGYYSSDGLPLIQWMRKPDDVNFYDLMELVAREHIHLNYDNYPLLSGTMMSSDRTKPLMLGKNIHYKGEIYTIVSGSLNVIKNAMDISIMQKVVPYQIAELAVINSPLESGSGSKVGSGNNEVIQFSGQAGNAKRIYQLHDSVEDEREDAYAIIDSENWDNAKRVKVSELGGLFNKAFDVQMDENGNVTAVIAKANLGARGGIAARYQGDWGDIPVTPTINSLSDINDVTITSPTNGQGLIYRDGVWVNEDVQGGVSGDYLPLSGGTVKGVIIASGNNITNVPIEVYTPSMGFTGYIKFHAGSYDELGHLGFSAKDTPAYVYGGVVKTLIHSGNIGSQSVNYATSAGSANLLKIGDIRDTNPTPNTLPYFSLSAWFSNVWNPTGDYWNSGITVKGWDSEYAVWQLASSANYGGNTQALYYRLGEGGTWYDWRRLLFNNDDNARFLNSAVGGIEYNTALTLQTNVASSPNYICGLAFNCLGAYSSTYENHTHAWIGLGPVVNTAEAEIYPLVFAVNGDTTTGANPIERMRIMPNGNVLIGTTTDSGEKLQVAELIRIHANASGYSGMHFNLNPSSSESWHLSARGGESGKPFRFYHYDGNTFNPRVDITSSGNVLIGTTTDNGYKLQVEGSFTLSNELYCGGWLRTYGNRGWYNETYGGGIYMDNSILVKTYGNKGMMSDFYSTSYGKSGNISEVGLNWYRIAKGEYGVSMILTIGKNYFHQSPDTQIYAITIGYYQSGGITLLSRGTNHTDTNRAIRISRIDSDNYAIDVLMYNSVANSDIWYISGLCSGEWVFQAPELVTDSPYVMQQLDLTWGVGFHTSNSMNVNGNIYASGGVTAKYASDIRLKENIQTISTEVALQTIMALNPITFRWNAKATELCSWLNGESQGFIAQEYESLIPNSGSEMWGEYRGIDYNRAIPYIVAVEQIHETRLQYLERENKELKQELQTLKREYYGNR